MAGGLPGSAFDQRTSGVCQNGTGGIGAFCSSPCPHGADRNSNRTQITGNLLTALYHHDASRALDPQLHTHCVIANVTIAPDGRRMALTESEMMKAVEFAGRLYQSSMARKCMEFGYKIRYKIGSKGMEGFEIDGVPDAVMQRYSRRRDEIEEEIKMFEAEHGREPTSAEINIIASTTREAKLKEISRSGLCSMRC
ncbi:MAG: MobF family relaxase [Victivallales bacterium]